MFCHTDTQRHSFGNSWAFKGLHGSDQESYQYYPFWIRTEGKLICCYTLLYHWWCQPPWKNSCEVLLLVPLLHFIFILVLQTMAKDLKIMLYFPLPSTVFWALNHLFKFLLKQLASNLCVHCGEQSLLNFDRRLVESPSYFSMLLVLA